MQIALPPETQNCTVWLSDLPDSFSEQHFAQLLDAVRQGVNLVVCGTRHHPLAVLDAWVKPSTDVEVFADFESGTYEGWTIEGNCFGERPATGKSIGSSLSRVGKASSLSTPSTLTTQQLGEQSPAPSKSPAASSTFSSAVVATPGRCCLNLLVDGKVVRTATGRNSEQLFPERWDVSEFIGKEARLEIVDMETGGWGHILVDHIVFSDSPLPPFVDPQAAKQLLQRLPFAWDELRWREGEPMSAVMNGSQRTLTVNRFWEVVGWHPIPQLKF